MIRPEVHIIEDIYSLVRILCGRFYSQYSLFIWFKYFFFLDTAASLCKEIYDKNRPSMSDLISRPSHMA